MYRESHMLPGVSPGKNTPIVTEFAGDAEKIKKYDTFDTQQQVAFRQRQQAKPT